jgi:hypothetical protein
VSGGVSEMSGAHTMLERSRESLAGLKPKG